MENKIKVAIEGPLKEINLLVDSITYEKPNLNIILDSDEIIDLDRIVKATRIIDKILDKEDFIKEKYMLDVSSKEKGDVK